MKSARWTVEEARAAGMGRDEQGNWHFRKDMGEAMAQLMAEDARRKTAGHQQPQIRVPRIRLPNKTEREWMWELQRRYPEAESYDVRYEPFTFNLPSGCKYTPDFGVFCAGIVIEFWEVKGPHIHNDASIRAFKEAKAAFPFWKFIFSQKRDGQWTTT